jgi:hypothetical protein
LGFPCNKEAFLHQKVWGSVATLMENIILSQFSLNRSDNSTTSMTTQETVVISQILMNSHNISWMHRSVEAQTGVFLTQKCGHQQCWFSIKHSFAASDLKITVANCTKTHTQLIWASCHAHSCESSLQLVSWHPSSSWGRDVVLLHH